MKKNPKNTLQEIYQGTSSDLPIYNTERIGGSAHQPTWVSSVTFGCHLNTIQGDECPTKKEAEFSAALKALATIEEKDRYIFKRKDPFHLYVDVENQPVIAKNLIQWSTYMDPISKNSDSYEITFVLSEAFADKENFTSLVKNAQSPYIKLHLFFLKGEVGHLSDASDMAIMYLASRTENTNVFIVSADKFASKFCSVANYISVHTFTCLFAKDEVFDLLFESHI